MSDGYGNSTSNESMREVAGIQKYARQVAHAAEALSKGDDPAQRLIDAVHSGRSTEVEEIFAEVGVDTRVTLTTADGLSRASTPTPPGRCQRSRPRPPHGLPRPAR